jgi:hypothetical protein
MIFVGFVLIAISFLCTWLGQPLWVIVGCAALGLLLICLRVIARR